MVEHIVTFIILLHHVSFVSGYEYEGYEITESFALKKNIFQYWCVHSYPYPMDILFSTIAFTLGYSRGKNTLVALQKNITFLSDEKLQIDSIECKHTTVFKCTWVVRKGKKKGMGTDESNLVTVIDNTHEVILTQKCDEPDIECETCRRAGANVIAAIGKKFQLSCSTLMSFPAAKPNPYRFRWFIDNSNSGDYIEIKDNITNSVPSSDNLTELILHQCVPLENKTSDFIFKPKMTKSSFINVKCRVDLHVEQQNVTKEKTIQICLCQKNNTHKIMLNHDRQRCNEPGIECETCRAPGDIIAVVGQWLQLSCSTLMSFTPDQQNPNRFKWYIDYANNGNYTEIKYGFTNSIPSSYKPLQNECTLFNNETSVLTFKPKMTDSSIINVKCEVDLDVEGLIKTAETTKQICLCQKNNTDKIMITHEKDNCDESDIYCKKCRRPGVDVSKMFGKSFKLSCSALMPFLGNQKTSNKFHWYIYYSNSGKYNQSLYGFTNGNPSFDNATDTEHPHCVTLLNKTSILKYEPEMWHSKNLTIRCVVHLGIDEVTEIKDTSVQICLYERGLGKKHRENELLYYTLVPVAVVVIVVVCLVCAGLRRRRKKMQPIQEAKQKHSTENNTKSSKEDHKATTGHSAHNYNLSRETDEKSYTSKPKSTTSKLKAAENVPDIANVKIKQKNKGKKSKKDKRSSKTKGSKLKKADKKWTPKSLKGQQKQNIAN